MVIAKSEFWEWCDEQYTLQNFHLGVFEKDQLSMQRKMFDVDTWRLGGGPWKTGFNFFGGGSVGPCAQAERERRLNLLRCGHNW